MTDNSAVRQPTLERLPCEVTSLAGRDLDATEVKRLVSSARIVTLTGAGGVGKTRLALHTALKLSRSFPGGVRMVDLAVVTEPGRLAHEVAATLGVTGRTPEDAVAERLRDQRSLLVLDNCEHLLEACADFVGHVVRMTPDLRVLCTSRQPLGAAGEHVWTLQPLAVPPTGIRLTAATFARYPALRLFADRAVAAAPDFKLTGANMDAVADICRRVDGLPLGIELAAAQLRSLSLDQVRAATATSVLSLTTRRSNPTRHCSLRQASDWGFALCTPHEQLLWTRASVFSDSFDLDAATDVCGAGLAPHEVLAALAGLVDKSVLIRVGDRYRLLENVREYGRTRLAANDHALRRRHLLWYLQLAERAETEWHQAGSQERAFAAVRAEHANLCAAIRDSLDTLDAHLALRLVGALWFYWAGAGFPADATRWLPHAGMDAKALFSSGMLAVTAGLPGQAAEMLTDCLDRPDTRALTLEALACTAITEGAPDLASSLLISALEVESTSDSTALRITARLALATALSGDHEHAQAISARVCHDDGDAWTAATADYTDAVLAFLRGEPDRAARHANDCLAAQHRANNLTGVGRTLELLTGLAFAADAPRRVAVLHGAACQLWESIGSHGLSPSLFPTEQHSWTEHARRVLGEHAYQQAVGEGAAMTLDETVAFALTGTTAPTVPAQANAGPFGTLTRRERQVADLVAQGMTNRQIAHRLRIAQRTAEGHVENILRKLAVGSRTQLAVLVARHRD